MQHANSALRPLLFLCVFASLSALPARLPAQASGALSAAPGGPAGTAPPHVVRLPVLAHDWPPPVVDISVSRIEMIQGITMGDSYTVHVANRPAVLRVFLSLTGQSELANVFGRLTRHTVGGVPQDALEAGPITLPASTDEGNLAQTLNFNLPSDWLAPGTQYALELDPDNAIRETDEANNRYPGSGVQSFDFVNAPLLEVVVVPIRYARPGAPESVPDTSDLSYLTWMPIKVFPVAQVVYTVRSAVHTFSGDLRSTGAWSTLLGQITDIHAVEDLSEQTVYYGLVDTVAVDGCSGGCIAGIGWVNSPYGFASKTAVGFAGFPSARGEASPTFTHEMGHNLGRPHAPCGTSNGVGPYPYGGGAPIGQWGYDLADGQLYPPTSYRDYMSYCSPEWTSDFTYRAIYDAWSWASQPFGPAPEVDAREALVLSGYVDAAGTLHLGPAFAQKVPAARFAGEGPYRLDLVDGAGAVLASRSFDAVPYLVDPWNAHDEAYDTSDSRGFMVALPPVTGARGLRVFRSSQLVYERQVSGPAASLRTGIFAVEHPGGQLWSLSNASRRPGLAYRASFSPDGGANWLLLEPGSTAPTIFVPAELLAGASRPVIEVQASDGLRVARATYTP